MAKQRLHAVAKRVLTVLQRKDGWIERDQLLKEAAIVLPNKALATRIREVWDQVNELMKELAQMLASGCEQEGDAHANNTSY